ncbi:hypothetical protein D3C87_1523730 [compost metagenome]
MRIAYFVKDIWVLTRHVGDDDVRCADLLIDAFEHRLGVHLLVYALRPKAHLFGGLLDAEAINIVEVLVEGHQHKDKRRRIGHWCPISGVVLRRIVHALHQC